MLSIYRINTLQDSNVLIDVPALGIMVLSGIILLPVLLPLAATDNGIKSASHGATSNNKTSYEIFSDVDKLSMGNIKASYVTSLGI